MIHGVIDLRDRLKGEGRRPRTSQELVADVTAAAQRLSIATRSWTTLPPSSAAIEAAQMTAEGLRLALNELHNATPRPAA